MNSPQVQIERPFQLVATLNPYDDQAGDSAHVMVSYGPLDCRTPNGHRSYDFVHGEFQPPIPELVEDFAGYLSENAEAVKQVLPTMLSNLGQNLKKLKVLVCDVAYIGGLPE
jgi:hypothetical protein